MTQDWPALEREFRGIVGDLPVELDREDLEQTAEALRSGALGPDPNRVPAARPADRADVDVLEQLRDVRLEILGSAAIERGEVAVAVLNGGMATRFGGVVKGTVPALGGRAPDPGSVRLRATPVGYGASPRRRAQG